MQRPCAPLLTATLLMVAALVSAGCADPAVPAVRGGAPCDHQLDDYVAGIDHVQVWWRLPGAPEYPPSGKAATVTLRHGPDIVARDSTTTDCLLVDMVGIDADRVTVVVQDGVCRYSGQTAFVYDGGFQAVEVTVERACA